MCSVNTLDVYFDSNKSKVTLKLTATVVERLEQLDDGAESRRMVMSSRLGFASDD